MGGIIGGIFQASAANKAAKAQERTAREDLEFQKEVYGDTIERVDPYYRSGITANNALNFELGLADRPTIGGSPLEVRTVQNGRGRTSYLVGDTSFNSMEEAQDYVSRAPNGGRPYEGFQATPGYAFQVSEAENAINALAGASGGLYSGRTLQALSDRRQGIANQEYNNYLNRLTGVSDTGLSAATLQANAGQNAASGVSNALGGIGNAQAAGAIGVGNAFTGALTNTLGSFNYQRNLTGNNGNSSFFNPLFGGPGLGNLF